MARTRSNTCQKMKTIGVLARLNNSLTSKMSQLFLGGLILSSLCLLGHVAYGFNVGNEGSYQYDYQQGRSGYQCSNFNADCDNGLGTCHIGSKTSYWNSIPHTFAVVTNRTSCLDGFVWGWKQWCNTDLELCAKFVLSNVFPGVFANNESSVNICLKDAGDDVDIRVTNCRR